MASVTWTRCLDEWMLLGKQLWNESTGPDTRGDQHKHHQKEKINACFPSSATTGVLTFALLTKSPFHSESQTFTWIELLNPSHMLRMACFLWDPSICKKCPKVTSHDNPNKGRARQQYLLCAARAAISNERRRFDGPRQDYCTGWPVGEATLTSRDTQTVGAKHCHAELDLSYLRANWRW